MAEKNDNCIIPAETADRLIAAHDAEAALYCIYLARRPDADDETAAEVLCRTRGEIAAAREKLGRILRSGGKNRPALPANEPGENDADSIVGTFREKAFEPILEEMTRILGATPSRAYLNTLVDIYNRLGMPPEVILVLLNHCDAETRRRYGPGRRPSPRFITEEAYRWYNRSVLTLEQADAYIREQEKRTGDKERIAALLGIRDRELTSGETKHIETWLEMGFADEAIARAREITLETLGTMKWPYMNGIIKKWHGAGIHTLDEIKKAEGARKKRGSGGKDPVGTIDVDEI